MLELRTIPTVRKRDTNAVVIATVTRGNRLPYLQRTWASILKQRPGVPVHLMIAANAPNGDMSAWLDEHRSRFSLLNISSHNRGQNIPMNEMIDEAVKLDARWFLRVDDDCFFERPKQWLKHMLNMQTFLMQRLGSHCVLGPQVNGLRNPPETVSTQRIRGGKIEAVSILGGICRMAPMMTLRYFRLNERMPMGYGEALQLANLCAAKGIPVIRDCTMVVTHGDSTDKQESSDSDWAYEHAMLQAIPYGL